MREGTIDNRYKSALICLLQLLLNIGFPNEIQLKLQVWFCNEFLWKKGNSNFYCQRQMADSQAKYYKEQFVGQKGHVSATPF